MSEELIQLSPKSLGRYKYFRLGSTTLSQLKKNKIIKNKVSAEISIKKPDGLVVLTGGDVKAVIEYKQPSELKTSTLINKAIAQEIVVARELCKLLIVTCGTKTIWINALNGERVLDESGVEVKKLFDVKYIEEDSLSTEEQLSLEKLIDKIDYSLTENNNTIMLPEVLDPSQLAKTIWQKIWINTGKEPERCLYNVVELFVFKFLSDVGVLKNHLNFTTVYQIMQSESATEALKHYSNTCRKEIRDLFPKGEDGTTVINGTIFVNEKGEPNIAQASLFGEVLADLQNYDNEYGSFKYIKKEFKTRLYESFLRQNAGVRSLGQYFTPRNVVKSVIKMSDASMLRKGARVCDPFCGVGGFLLEAIAENRNILNEFIPSNGEVEPKIQIVGYDKGSDEKEDERTIILAKANMLIYFSDLLVKYHTKDYLKAFAKGAFNRVFHLLRTNLGTFKQVKDEPYDLILTNPPYVTSGSSSLRRSLEEEGLSNYYSSGGRGTESLAMEWIVKNLKINGQAIVIVPDGLLIQEAMLSFIKDNCFIEAIISLPFRTFYSTPKKTYILALRKKEFLSEIQVNPIFTFIVSDIGETRDAKRWATDKNDLDEMSNMFNQFKATPSYFISQNEKCKIIDFKELNLRSNWLIERLWTPEERISIGLDNEISELTQDDFLDRANALSSLLDQFISNFSNDEKSQSIRDTRIINLGDNDIFQFITLKTGWTKEVYQKMDVSSENSIPVYTASESIVAHVCEVNDKIIRVSPNDKVFSFASNGDGSAGRNFIIHDKDFYVSNDRTVIKILNEKISLNYVLFCLRNMKNDYGFNFSFKANVSNVKNVSLEIPIDADADADADADFDYKSQELISQRFSFFQNFKKEVESKFSELDNAILPVEEFMKR
ncbi:class I SAM-dependent DNA methyltransferase [Pectobacterium sp. 21LCBS03]|uniref:HsdM family class I SAM-dependent methyltransferase n=1 Tax=Pectobacterium sp. 21LCBS03 TaxID=2935858 RepID=UPI00200CE1B7|nr:N-6 DNA methylase [Pectobacterium sp. 21LCBS03]UPY94988.1 SAM-dependent methyltransferase [Pectobacterium sp. 21LCBS03]